MELDRTDLEATRNQAAEITYMAKGFRRSGGQATERLCDKGPGRGRAARVSEKLLAETHCPACFLSKLRSAP